MVVCTVNNCGLCSTTTRDLWLQTMKQQLLVGCFNFHLVIRNIFYVLQQRLRLLNWQLMISSSYFRISDGIVICICICSLEKRCQAAEGKVILSLKNYLLYFYWKCFNLPSNISCWKYEMIELGHIFNNIPKVRCDNSPSTPTILSGICSNVLLYRFVLEYA